MIKGGVSFFPRELVIEPHLASRGKLAGIVQGDGRYIDGAGFAVAFIDERGTARSAEGALHAGRRPEDLRAARHQREVFEGKGDPGNGRRAACSPTSVAMADDRGDRNAHNSIADRLAKTAAFVTVSRCWSVHGVVDLIISEHGPQS